MSKPKLDTFIDRIKAVMLDAGANPEQLEAVIAEICSIEVQAVSTWFEDPDTLPFAEHIAALTVFYDSDMVWLTTGKFSSTKAVCDRYNAEVYSCTVASETLEAKGLSAREISVTRNYKN